MRVEARGRVWESTEAQIAGVAKSKRYFQYHREFEMPTAPTPYMLLKFERLQGEWLRLRIAWVEWNVDQNMFVCEFDDYLLSAFQSVGSLTEAADMFAGHGLIVERSALDESESERLQKKAARNRRKRSKSLTPAERKAEMEEEEEAERQREQEKFEKSIVRFSDLD